MLPMALCAVGLVPLRMAAQSTEARPDLPIDYVAKFNLAQDGASFVTEETPSSSGYFSYAEANEKFAPAPSLARRTIYPLVRSGMDYSLRTTKME